MKFLTFNIVVAAALGYLLLGDRPEIRDNQVTSGLVQSAENAWDKLKGTSDTVPVQPTPEPVAETKQVSPEPEPALAKPAQPEPKPVAEVAKAPEAPPAPKALPARRAPAPVGQEVEVANLDDNDKVVAPPKSALPQSADDVDTEKAEQVASKDPAAARRRAEVLGEKAVSSEPAPQFMSARDRRRELLRLAEDMELQYLDSVRH